MPCQENHAQAPRVEQTHSPLPQDGPHIIPPDNIVTPRHSLLPNETLPAMCPSPKSPHVIPNDTPGHRYNLRRWSPQATPPTRQKYTQVLHYISNFDIIG